MQRGAENPPRPGAAGLGGQDGARQPVELPSPTDEPVNHCDSFLLVLVSVDFLLCRITLQLDDSRAAARLDLDV